jgi:hypothetical protein
MKDQIIDLLEGFDPVDALQNLFSVSYEVAMANGIGSFTLTQMFSSIADARFDVAAAAEEAAEEAEEAEDEEAAE